MMPSKTSLQRELFAAIGVGVAFSLIIIFFVILDGLSQNSYALSALPTSSQGPQPLIGGAVAASAFPEQARPGLPLRLKIPQIKVDAAIEQVGLTSDGAVGVPKDPANAAWFDRGPRPGDTGSAIVVGHYGRWKNGNGSVFDNVYKLRAGDKIYVDDEQGVTTTFVVRELRTYDPKASAPDVFDSSDGKAHLNLITCEGVWDKVAKSYPERLVVFADKEEISDDRLITSTGSTTTTPTTTVVAVPTACAATTIFTKRLSPGSADPQVLQLQHLLRCLGFLSADIVPTGYFGPKTQAAVRRFQSANGITAIGYVGPATRSALNHYVIQ